MARCAVIFQPVINILRRTRSSSPFTKRRIYGPRASLLLFFPVIAESQAYLSLAGRLYSCTLRLLVAPPHENPFIYNLPTREGSFPPRRLLSSFIAGTEPGVDLLVDPLVVSGTGCFCAPGLGATQILLLPAIQMFLGLTCSWRDYEKILENNWVAILVFYSNIDKADCIRNWFFLYYLKWRFWCCISRSVRSDPISQISNQTESRTLLSSFFLFKIKIRSLSFDRSLIYLKDWITFNIMQNKAIGVRGIEQFFRQSITAFGCKNSYEKILRVFCFAIQVSCYL